MSAIQQAGYTQTIQAVSSIISPGAAAFLYSVWPLNAIILLDIAGAVLACITVAISEIPTPNLCAEQKNQQFMQDLKEGYTILRKDRGLSVLLWIGVILSIWGGIKKRRYTICFSILPDGRQHYDLRVPAAGRIYRICRMLFVHGICRPVLRGAKCIFQEKSNRSIWGEFFHYLLLCP